MKRLKNVDAERFRRSFRGLAGSVAVVLASHDPEGVKGIVCTSAVSLSSSPPMILICIDDKTGMSPLIERCGDFSVNYLASEFASIAQAFTKGIGLENVAPKIIAGRTGTPTLGSGTCSVLECRVDAIHPGGDHSIICGVVQHARFQSDADPLLYRSGRYGAFALPDDMMQDR
jgi:flavin reductase (DIM6/NTAB) family NADH-FMN oxidoreductase RutF